MQFLCTNFLGRQESLAYSPREGSWIQGTSIPMDVTTTTVYTAKAISWFCPLRKSIPFDRKCLNSLGEHYSIKQPNITKKKESKLYSHKPIAYIGNSHINFVYMCVYILHLYINNTMKCKKKKICPKMSKQETSSEKQRMKIKQNKTVLGKRDCLE